VGRSTVDAEVSRVPLEPVRILVLYSHALMGRGIERMLADEPGVAVDAVDLAVGGAVDEALAREPSIVILEEGGGLDAADLVRRSRAPVVVDVDIATSSGWMLRRESLTTRPDNFLRAIRQAMAGAEAVDETGDDARELEADEQPAVAAG
jgi:DNA-binding NarL/FixJ family response regulator